MARAVSRVVLAECIEHAAATRSWPRHLILSYQQRKSQHGATRVVAGSGHSKKAGKVGQANGASQQCASLMKGFYVL